MAPSYYPVDEETDSKRVATSVRLQKEQHEDIELIAKLWNEIDEELGRKRPRKWKASSVIERLIAVGIAGFWEQAGARPEDKADRDQVVAHVIERLKKSNPKK